MGAMKLLAFETATEACSVAVWSDGEVRERFEIAPRRHAELALPWAEQLLARAGVAKSQLDAIAVGRGPGAFTGVRLAVALAQGMALALDLPVVPVSTLAVLAQSDASAARLRVAAIDEQRDRTGLGGGLDGEQLHRAASSSRRQEYTSSSSCSSGSGSAATASMPKKRCTSPSTRVRGSGGRLSRNRRP